MRAVKRITTDREIDFIGLQDRKIYVDSRSVYKALIWGCGTVWGRRAEAMRSRVGWPTALFDLYRGLSQGVLREQSA